MAAKGICPKSLIRAASRTRGRLLSFPVDSGPVQQATSLLARPAASNLHPHPLLVPQVEAPTSLMGLAKVAAAAGYEPVYKGKLHIMSASGPNDTAVPDDAGQYGWTRCV